MKALQRVLVVSTLFFAGTAAAALIQPGFNSDGTPCIFGTNCWEINRFPPSQPSLTEFANYVGANPASVSFLYKDDAGGSESGPFAGNYNTAYTPNESNASGGTMSWTGGDFISCLSCYLWVKDGNHQPSLYLFDISWWNGMETLSLSGFWPGPGAISNIGVFGSLGERPPTQVTEPGTVGLLGLGLLAFCLVRRRGDSNA